MSRINLKLVTLFYMALFTVGIFWMWLRGDTPFFVHPDWSFDVTDEHVMKGVMLGAFTAAFLVTLSRLSSQYLKWAKGLEREFANILGKLQPHEMLLLALFSGVGEEVFFRGAMQPALGLLPTSLLFGALHLGPTKKFLPWTFFAFLAGLLFGWYYEVNGTLAAPITCHTLVNLVNIWFINREHEEEEQSEEG